MKALLLLKPWQLFILLFVSLLVPSDHIIGQIITFIGLLLYITWVYTVGATAFNRLKNHQDIKINYFNFSIFFVMSWLVGVTLMNGGYNINQDNYQDYGNSIWFIIPLHIYGMWSIFYIFYFAAKMLKSVSVGKIVPFDQAFGYFFGFWFFPVGIWFIQPEAQKLIDKNHH